MNPFIFGVVWCVLAVLSYHFIDLNLSIYQHQVLRYSPILIGIFSKITLLGNSAPYLIGSALLFLWARFLKKNKGWAQAALYIFISVVIADIVCDAIKIIVGRARPLLFFSQDLYGFYFWQFRSPMQSFPSGHTTTIAAFSSACAFLWPAWRWAFLLLIALVAASRVILGAHYLSDVMAGFYLGFITAYCLYHWHATSVSGMTVF